MPNPFEDDEGRYLALVNMEGQYSLWPAFIGIPAGWTVALEEASRKECLSFIDSTWSDMRPASLIRAGRPAGGTADDD